MKVMKKCGENPVKPAFKLLKPGQVFRSLMNENHIYQVIFKQQAVGIGEGDNSVYQLSEFGSDYVLLPNAYIVTGED